MRINRRSLDRVIRNTVEQRTRTDRNLLSIYLCGSILEDDYDLGGTVDIDLVFVHTGPVEHEREIVRLTDEVHLDIAHHDQKEYRDTRRLRVHPWMGPNVSGCEICYDPEHFMDYTQASVRGQYDRPDHVLMRARTQADSARKIWFSYEMEYPDAGPNEISAYLLALGNSANALSSLNGTPLTDRRFLLKFPQRTETLGRPGLFPGFMGLLGTGNVQVDTIKSWLTMWEAAYESLPVDLAPARLHPVRKAYYLRAFHAILEGDQPGAVLWPLLRTWTHIVDTIPEDNPARDGWCEVMEQLGFLGDGFGERIKALDAYLDQVEETLDDWARAQGVL